MKRFVLALCSLVTAVSVSAAAPKIDIKHVEPLSWWVGMTTDLQIMVNGNNISLCDVQILPENQGVSVTALHKAESPNYLFVDVAVASDAKAGEYTLRFTNGKRKYDYKYTIAERREGSRERLSFTNADFVYLIMPDRFANGDPENDSTNDTAEKADRSKAWILTVATRRV
jgi:hypothetical protein